VSRSHARGGFTLIEITVVMAIIALLIGMLLPALGAARGAARTVQSLSNLRQMAFAAQRYADRWDRWPPGVWYEAGEGGLRTIAWDWREDETGAAVPGPLWSYTDHPDAVMRCPEYHGEATFGADPVTGYNYNITFLGGEAPYGTLGFEAMRWGLRPAAARRTGTTVIFGAGGRRGGTNKFMRAPGNSEGLDPWTLLAGGQAFRYHGGQTVMAYLDGHVGSGGHARVPEDIDPQVVAFVMDHPHNGFLAMDDGPYDPR
jgi:prepilin-type N-terminal cleavage/methylation domain-containing protein/prepilin-type processing-associated H-X9-DG protein